MRQPDDDGRLLDMLVACREARELASKSSLPDLYDDRLLQLGLVKLIEIIGEAASRVTSERQEAIPEIPWRRIIGMRHRLVHGYDEVDYEIVWGVVIDELPPLVAIIEANLPAQ